MTTTHTPGPWQIDGDGGVIYGNGGIREETTWDICTLAHDFHDEDDANRGAADARLIAAAPELLAALEKAVAYENAFDEGVYPPWYRAACAAIAKAKGEQAWS